MATKKKARRSRPYKFERGGKQFGGRDARWWIQVPQLRTLSADSFLIDSRVAVDELDPGGYLILIPAVGEAHLSLTEAVFYTHALSYELDVPCILTPAVRGVRATMTPIVGKPLKGADFYDAVSELAYQCSSMRLGGGTSIYFRRSGDWYDDDFDLPLTARYGANAGVAVAMYSTALRQVEPLSELVQYYRVLELADVQNGGHGNGKAWIGQALARLKTHDFGRLYGNVFGRHRKRVGHRDVEIFSRFRSRALARLRHFAAHPPTQGTIEKYLWEEVRCGIAHGKSGQKTYDFDVTLQTTSRDVALVKMLARLAIDEMVPAALRRSRHTDNPPPSWGRGTGDPLPSWPE